MKVLMTGGTGYVGSHAVAALQQAGHGVRLLARSPEKVQPNLSPLGAKADEVEIVSGDVMEARSVTSAVEGCDAAVHAASIYSLDSRRAAELMRVNVEGTRTVLESAVRAGLDPVVYVSSAVCLRPARPGEPLGPDSPVRETTSPYGRSKAEAERVARRMQEEGAPVTIVYPARSGAPATPTWANNTRSPRTSSAAGSRCSRRAGSRSWMPGTWARRSPRSWNRARVPGGTWCRAAS